MTITLVVEENRIRPWLPHLMKRLSESLREQPVSLQKQEDAPLTFPLALFLKPTAVANSSGNSSSNDETIIDFTHGHNAGNGKRTIIPLFNGARGEDALIAHLIKGTNPVISLWSPDDQKVIAKGIASLEAAGSLSEKLEAVYSRVITLLLKVLEGREEDLGTIKTAQAKSPTSLQIIKYLAKNVKSSLVRMPYRMLCHTPHWRIGWRFIGNQSVLDNKDLTGIPWTVLSGENDHFYADPFPFQFEGRDYLFFEDLDHKTKKGVIAVLEFDNKGPSGPIKTVLEEPWHLSYPFLLEWKGEIYMIPEASLSKKVTAYRAVDFPIKWEPAATLLDETETADATIIEYQGRLWMFSVRRHDMGGYSDTLEIHYADDLFGPWHAHKKNPILVHPKFARPAGNMVVRDGKIIRPVQNCEAGYGMSIALMEVTELTEDTFTQRPLRDLFPGGPWPGRKLHTLNRAGGLEVIDGSVIRPKWPFLTRYVEKLTRPQT